MPAAPSELPLVGRDDELAALRSAHAEGDRLVILEGEPGIGKSRLARELMASVGGLVLSARCHEDEAGLPYGPIVELLGEAARRDPLVTVPAQRLADAAVLAPELAREGLPAPLEMSGPGAQARLLEGIAAVLGVAGLVFVDDVHAADEATIEVLAFLARRLRGRGLLLLLAWRWGHRPAGHRLRRLEGTVLALGRARRGAGRRVGGRGRPSASSPRARGCRSSSPSTSPQAAGSPGARCATSWPRAWPASAPRRASCSRPAR